MKSLATTIRKPYLWAVSVTLTMSLLFTGVVSSVYAIDMGASFTPENEEVVDSVVTDVIISFDNPVYADTTQTVFTGDTLASIITFKTDDANGADIPFSATINPENTAVTVSPTTTLESGTVYIAIADGYYNEGGEQGDAAVATFSVSVPEAPESTETQEATEEASEPEDTTAPTVSAITPGNGEIITDNTRNITITFSEAVFKDTEDGVFDADALATVVMLKTTDASGTDIPFTASISEDNTVITVDPSDNLTDDTVYAGVTDGYYDASDNQGSASGVAFFVSAATQQQVVTPEEVAPEAPESTETQEATEEASEPEDTTAPTVSAITPGNGEIITDNTRNITITFSEAVFKDTEDGVFDADALATVVMLKTTDASGTDIPFTASISEDNTVITVDPSDNLTDDTVYAGVTDGYYDASDNQGSASGVAFFVSAATQQAEVTAEPAETVVAIEEDVSEPADTAAPTVSVIAPENGEVVTDNTRNITISFSEAVFRNEQGAVFTTENLPGLITLRTENVNGYAIPFTAEMSDDNTTVTLDPNGVLANGGVYLAISRDYYDVDSMRGTAEKITFTVETGEEEGEEFISKFFSGDLFRLLGGQTIPSVDEAAEGTPPTISQTYTFGMFDNDIRLAQQYLDRTECPIVSAVPGDSENAIIMVGYIDALTQQALRCYQAEKGFEVTGSLTPETFNQLAEEYYLQRSEESDAVNPIVTVVDEYLFNQSIIQQMLFLLRQAVERTGQINEDIVEGEESSDEQENEEQSQEGTPAPTVETEEQVAEEQAAQPPTPNVEN